MWHQLTVEKRQNPADDMLSRLTQVTVDRGDGVETGLDDVEITGFATLLGGAGAETVTKLVGNAVVLFWKPSGPVAEDPRRPCEDSARSTRSSDTCRRRSTRVGFACRSACSKGARCLRASRCLLITGAATRDPRAFERPDEFDIERNPGITIGFGHGVHSCLGAALGADGEPHRDRRDREAVA